MNSLIIINNIVVEFPENDYAMATNKSSNSDYEHVLLMPCHRVTASNLFRWFRGMKSKCSHENGNECVSAMITVFREFHDELFPSLREYVLIDGILLTSYDLLLQDSDLICQILDLIYGCWYSFGPLHFKAILERRTGRNQPHLLSFFLEHARLKKLVYDGIRMIDVSIYSSLWKSAAFLAADMWSWKELLIYLQYGARFEKEYLDPVRSRYGISSALVESLRTLIRHLWIRLVHPTADSQDSIKNYCKNLDVEVKNLCRTVNVLLRGIRKIHRGSLDFIIKECDQYNRVTLIPSRNIMTHETAKIMIPMLFKRYECPEELKHVCRWTIRQRLNENWQLPHGIRGLPIPDSLRRYLNLQVD